MGQKTKFPKVIDEMPFINNGFLNKCGFFMDGKANVGSFIIHINGEALTVSAIGIMDEDPRLILKYHYAGETVRETIKLFSRPSNLGLGKIHGFICPRTGKRAYKLHLVHGRFIHRSAMPKALYRCQTRSQKFRQMDKDYRAYLELDNLYEEINAPGFRKTYRGKPTKRYLKIMARIKQAEKVQPEDLIHAVNEWSGEEN